MSLFFKRASALAFSLVLISCGGGGGGGNPSSGSLQDGNASGSGSQNPGGPSQPSGGSGGSPSAAFAASLVQAPAEGTTMSGSLTLEIRGSGIENAELLPDSEYTPSLGKFTVSSDKRSAKLNLDTKTIPNGPIQLRISAFNAPVGTASAEEIVAMPVRTWTLNNQPAPSGSQAGRAAKCQQRGLSYTDMNDSLPVVCIIGEPVSPQLNYDQCVASGYQFDTGYNNPADALPVLRDGRLINKFYCTPPAINGTVNPGCLCVQNK